MDVRYSGNEGGSPSDLDWGDCGTMGPTMRSSSILEIARELAFTKVCKATWMLRHLKFLPEKFFCEKRKGIQRTFKQFRNKVQDRKSKYGFQKMKATAS